jgi:hypothetical protein
VYLRETFGRWSMKRIIGIALILMLAFGVGAAFGANPKPGARAQFLNMGPLVIDGELRAPTVTYTNTRDKVRFGRLLKLRKSFMYKIQESGSDRALK